jgi:hypothetical protein
MGRKVALPVDLALSVFEQTYSARSDNGEI